MDRWKYFDITHKMHLVCNPMVKGKFYRLCGLLPLGKGSRVLDIACGKGEFLVRLAELHGVSGVGVDLSPYCIRDCERKKQERVPEADLVFIEMDGADYTPEDGEKYHLARLHRGELGLRRIPWDVAGSPRDDNAGRLGCSG